MGRAEISVIIPTHNRAALLTRCLDALASQTYRTDRFEVVVVADGCQDQTREVLATYRAPFQLRAIHQDGLGAAVARNRGAAAANGDLLLFVDDDVEASPELVGAHVAAQAQAACNGVVIGNLLYAVQGRATLHQIGARAWFGDLFIELARPGHRFCYTDLLSGNFSITRTLFESVGRFDEGMPCREDYELGARLIKSGATFRFCPEALGSHYDDTTAMRVLRRKRQEGRADVLIGQRHPELRPVLRLARLDAPASRRPGWWRKSAFIAPRIGDAVARQAAGWLGYLERIRLRGRWTRLFSQLMDYWYWRGVADELRSLRAFASYLQAGPPTADCGGLEIELDISADLEAAERLLDDVRPAGARVLYGGQPIGRIPPIAGAEPLRGAHLRPAIEASMLWPLILERAWVQAARPTACVERTDRDNVVTSLP